jgi:hypothetical protein
MILQSFSAPGSTLIWHPWPSGGNMRNGFLGLGGLGSEICPTGLNVVNIVSAASRDEP